VRQVRTALLQRPGHAANHDAIANLVPCGKRFLLATIGREGCCRSRRSVRPAAEAGLLPTFPFGTDFTAVEQRLIPALQVLKTASPPQLAALLMRGLGGRADCADCLDRLGLARPKRMTEWFYAALVRGALAAAGS
jgi:hypothetical protein